MEILKTVAASVYQEQPVGNDRQKYIVLDQERPLKCFMCTIV